MKNRGPTSKPSRSIIAVHGGKRGKRDPGLEPHLSETYEKIKTATDRRAKRLAARGINRCHGRQAAAQYQAKHNLTPTAHALQRFHRERETAKQFPELEPARQQKIARIMAMRKREHRHDPFA